MKLFLITGASRGLGEALGRKLLNKNHRLVCFSRNRNALLIEEAASAQCVLDYEEADLSRVDQLEERLQRIVGSIPSDELESACLINNAGILDPIGPVENSSADAISHHIQLNLTAPIILTSCFIRLTDTWKLPKTILNISSGAGKTAYSGWSSYCASKAGLDHFTRCIGLEQKEKDHGVRVISVAPGVIDTGMQAKIRSLREEDFPQKERFVQLKEEGRLSSPEAAADKLLQLLFSGDYEHGDVLDIRNL